MNLETILDVVGVLFIVVGTVFTFIAALGAVRYNDLLSRQHVATKPQVFSLICTLVGVMLVVRENSMTWTLLVVIAFQLITSPISAHIISRAGYFTGRVDTSTFDIDELTQDARAGNDQG